MQTKESKQAIQPKLPISTVSTTQADYGSTTATESGSFGKAIQYGSEKEHNQAAEESRFPSRGDHKTASSNTKRDITSPNPGFSYQSLSDTKKSSTLTTDSRFPSFVNLPASATGRFRFHAMESSGKQSHHASTIKILEYSFNVLNHVLIGFVTIYMSWLCFHVGLAGTALHAWLVTIGFTFLMAEGIMCYYPSNVLTFSYQRDTKTTAHWILQALGGGLGIIGALIKLIQKGFLLTSTHGQLGLAALILCVFSMLAGLSALNSMRLKKLLSPLLSKTVHNLLGYITFIIAMLAQFYGYKTGFFLRKTDSDFRDLMKSITILSLALTSIGPLKAFLRKTQMVYRQYAN